MDAAKYIWMNGKFVNWDDAKVHVLSHTIHYGNGVIEGTKAHKTEKGYAIFRLNEHTTRLKESEIFVFGVGESKTPISFRNACDDFILTENLGESKEDFPLLEKFIKENSVGRITIYALRPVRGTPFEHGPDSLDVSWWIAKTRIAFPKIELIVGTARYRIPEISLFLNAGANAITKLPATNMFNTKDALRVNKEFEKVNRTFTGTFVCEDVFSKADWDGMLDRLDITAEERVSIRKTLWMYLESMDKKYKSLSFQES
jgi:hypothetical protein